MGDKDFSSEVLLYIVDIAYDILREEVLEAGNSTDLGLELPVFIKCDKDQSKTR